MSQAVGFQFFIGIISVTLILCGVFFLFFEKRKQLRRPGYVTKKLDRWGNYFPFILVFILLGADGVLSLVKVQKYAIYNGQVMSGSEYVVGADPNTPIHMITVNDFFVNSLSTKLVAQALYSALNINFTERSGTRLEYATSEEYEKVSKRSKKESIESMYVAAYDYVGRPLSYQKSVIVVTTYQKFPSAHRLLQENDEIVAYDGKPMVSIAELHNYILDRKPESIAFNIIRSGSPLKVDIDLDRSYGDGIVSLGFAMSTVLSYPLPNDAPRINEKVWGGGNSGGTMMAIQVVSSLQHQDLSHGIPFAGTGAIDAAGNVGTIGGLYNKIATVHKKGGIKHVLVPKQQGDEALKAKEQLQANELEIHPYANLNEAISILDSLKE